MENKLKWYDLGFDVSHMKGGGKVNQVIPGMFCAGDSVVLADSRDRLQQLIKVYGGEGDSLGLKFSSDSAAIMVYNDEKEEPAEN